MKKKTRYMKHVDWFDPIQNIMLSCFLFLHIHQCRFRVYIVKVKKEGERQRDDNIVGLKGFGMEIVQYFYGSEIFMGKCYYY